MKLSRFCWVTGILILLTFATLALAQSGSELTSPGMPGKMKQAIEKSLADTNFADKTKAVIKAGDIKIKRPGTGLAPKQLDDIIGLRASKDIAADSVITEEMIVWNSNA